MYDAFKILWLCGILNSTQEYHESRNELLYRSVNSLLQNLQVVQYYAGYWFQSLFAIFSSLLCLQLLDSLFHCSFPLHFGTFSSVSPFHHPGQVSICFSRLLSTMCNTCPCHFNMLFSIVSKIVILPFTLLIHFLLLIFWMFLQLFSKIHFCT